jgi:hypothetical protein
MAVTQILVVKKLDH